MITVHGRRWGTATEVAHALGADVTPDMIRKWAVRDGLTKIDRWYALDEAAAIERQKRTSGRGRKRLDARAHAA